MRRTNVDALRDAVADLAAWLRGLDWLTDAAWVLTEVTGPIRPCCVVVRGMGACWLPAGVTMTRRCMMKL